MDLVKCPRCGEMYSPSYRTCPFCEEDDDPGKKLFKAHGGHRASNSTNRKKAYSARGALIAVLLVVLALLSWYLFGDQIRENFARRGEEKPPVEDQTQPNTPDDGNQNVDPNAEVDPNAPVDPAPENPPAPVDPGVTVDVSGAVLNKTDYTAQVGETVQLNVSGTEATPTWSVQDSNIATVSESGAVVGVAGGTTKVIATVGNRTLECIVRIKGGSAPAQQPASGNPTINKTDFTAKVGERVQLRVSGTSSAVSWSIGNSNVATIDASGVVRGVHAGTTTAYAKVDGKVLECIVRIK
ncbi:MAG: Ig-like domain-containing protein [Oscillospiraceae bacterium]|nr:Ig-like domain-containing protein [Oscillospiraceae bacterium]